jgi:hypothetical protein
MVGCELNYSVVVLIKHPLLICHLQFHYCCSVETFSKLFCCAKRVLPLT